MAKAQEIAVRMEAAAKQTNELQVSSKSLELNMVTVDNLKPCFCFAKRGHTPENCYFKRQKCRNCGKQGHTYKVCRAPPTESASPTEKSQPTAPQAGIHPQKHQNYFVESEELGLFTVKDGVHSGILIDLSINGTPITMTLDTRASISIISEKIYKTQLPHLHLHKSDILLRTYTGENLTICGKNQVVVKYKNQQYLVGCGRGWATIIWMKLATTNYIRLERDWHGNYQP